MSEERPGILVINPNSNQAVTDGLARTLAPLAVAGGPAIRCLTLAEGPFGIESQADVDAVVEPLRRLVAGSRDAAAFVIACYSDPGLAVCRAASEAPVYGIQESGVRAALAEGARFGVIALGADSIRRHLPYLRRLGVIDRLAGERAADLSVAESAAGEGTFRRLCEVGTALRDRDGADVVILGCAGMAEHRQALEARLGIPVIDPTQAAVKMALARCRLRGDSSACV